MQSLFPVNCLETIVKNGGHKMYRAVGAEGFMKDLGEHILSVYKCLYVY